jgi:plasmid stabilization system protein ParE
VGAGLCGTAGEAQKSEMRRQVIYDQEARLEFEDAVEWYNEREPGLGERFRRDVDATIERILKDPERFSFSGRTIHKARLETFDKYNIHFRIKPEFIVVVAVFHGARAPARLRRRLK